MNPLMTMMNNSPEMQIVSMLRSGKNPGQILAAMARNNPQVNQVMKMMQGKSPQELQQMAQNMAAERGTTVEDIARQLGITIPSNR